MFYAISYDIGDDKRRNTVSKILEGYGSRVQLSLFECNLASDRLQELLQKLESCIDTNEDSVRCYPLCNACAKNVQQLGGPPVTRESGYYMA